MKKKILGAAAVALAGMLVLTACTSSDTGTSQNGANPGGSTQDASQSGTNTGGSTQDASQSGTNIGGSTQDASQSGADAGSGTQDAGSDSGASAPEVSGDASQAADAGASEDAGSDDIPEIPVDGDEDSAASRDIWSGTYVGTEETVTLAKLDDTAVSFSFAQSGISGTAQVQGSQAVYRGDDHYVVVFNINDTVLDVSVSSEEDYDASGSPLIGTYVRDGGN